MKRKRTLEDWRRDVFASQSPNMTAATKVLCLYLADHMKPSDRMVSVPRDTIARDLGIHRARVAERLQRAIEAGFLVRAVRGRTLTTAVYQGTWPDVSVQRSGKHVDTAPPDAQTTAERYPQIPGSPRRPEFVDTALQDATTRADLSPSGHDRDEGTYEKAEDHEPAVDLTDCEWHRPFACPTDCRNAERRSA